MLDTLKTILQQQEVVLDADSLTRCETFYIDLMDKNLVMDLTNIIEPREVALRHFGDSLFLTKCADFAKKKVIDIGTGAGFPAMPLLCAMPDLQVTMVDSTEKRIEFLQEEVGKMATFPKAKAISARAEDLGIDKRHREQYDIAVSRAVARLNILCELCLPLVKAGGVFLAMKSDNDECDVEVAEALGAIKTLGGNIVKTINYQLAPDCPPRRIIVIKKDTKTPLHYPRKYAKIKAKPL